jgi:hypothetical protein
MSEPDGGVAGPNTTATGHPAIVKWRRAHTRGTTDRARAHWRCNLPLFAAGR